MSRTRSRRAPQHSVYLWTLPMFHCNGWCFSTGKIQKHVLRAQAKSASAIE